MYLEAAGVDGCGLKKTFVGKEIFVQDRKKKLMHLILANKRKIDLQTYFRLLQFKVLLNIHKYFIFSLQLCDIRKASDLFRKYLKSI